MSASEYFYEKTKLQPTIYAYEFLETHKGFIKIGYTERDVKKRIQEQLNTPNLKYKILGTWPAIRNDGSFFRDKNVHSILEKNGFHRMDGHSQNEWFNCKLGDIQAAIIALQTGTANIEKRTQDFKMRPEQEEAVKKTMDYFLSAKADKNYKTPKFLWNAKMRFGKTFTAYELARKMGFKRILILTFKPAIKASWREDLKTHINYEGWQFISRPEDTNEPDINDQYKKSNKDKPIVCFGSFQDFLGHDKKTNGIKFHNQWVHTINWDIVIFDEYHYGAWRNSAKELFEQDDDMYDEYIINYDAGNARKEESLPITAKYYLYLSGTPFRALAQGEFIEEQIFSWTYSDEQYAKELWDKPNNPYASLPKMIMFTYQMPTEILEIASQGEFNEFDLNEFFRASGNDNEAKFIHEEYVQKWLDLIRGAYISTTVEELKLGAEKPPMPFSDSRLLDVLLHTLWFLPNVASCYAMANLLKTSYNNFFHQYKINICAGKKAGNGTAALFPVQRSMENPLETKTITLSCGKLTTGVTIKPWTGIFMLRDLQSPETYFQAAFRVQSPWEIIKEDGKNEIIKKYCYIFDFSINRALRLIAEYSCKLSSKVGNPEIQINEFIKFLPVLAFDGSTMQKIDAADILQISTSGTTATLLAKRWESALLVNVDNETLERLLRNEKAMAALNKIEGFRSINLYSDMETIINKSLSVNEVKKSGEKLSKQKQKELSATEKEYKSKRKYIQDKLIKFATRIPIFMYLTDFREYSLKDVITQLEPKLFEKVTGLEVYDFELLVSLNVFNEALMNDAVYKFKRYEDSSLDYTGINKHSDEITVGLYSSTISKDDYDDMNAQFYDSMKLES